MEEVDAFLEAVRDTFVGIREPPLTAGEIRTKMFMVTLLRPGYVQQEVDAFLQEVEAKLPVRCAECGAETAEATGFCAWCGAPAVRAPIPPLPSQVTNGFPLPADIGGAEPSPRRRRMIQLTAAGVSVAAAVAVTAIVLSSSPAHKPTAAVARASAPARTPAAQVMPVSQLRAGDCLQGPPDINTTRWWPSVVTAVPCNDNHLAEVYFFSAHYWPAGMAFPGKRTILHQVIPECRKAFHAYDGIPLSRSEYSFREMTVLSAADWGSGDRILICNAYLRANQSPGGEPLYGSIKGSDA